MERNGGKVAAQVTPNVSGWKIEQFVKGCVQMGKSKVMTTDEYKGYDWLDNWYSQRGCKTQRTCADGDGHTNTIESFWAIVKRAWYGVYHRYSRKYMPLYIAEACYRYNRRCEENLFLNFAARMFYLKVGNFFTPTYRNVQVGALLYNLCLFFKKFSEFLMAFWRHNFKEVKFHG